MKYFKIVILVSSLLITSFTSLSQNKLKTGFYYLAEKENGAELIKDIDSEEKFAVDKNEILTVEDFSSLKLLIRNFEPNPLKVIELKLTKNGRKKWIEIKNRISKTGESILFICNDNVYLEKTIIGKSNLKDSTIDLFIESKYQEAIMEIIKSEISNSR